MFKTKALVIEVEDRDNFFSVCVDRKEGPVLYNVVGADDSGMALCSALEYIYGDCDYTYTCCSKDGVYCLYDVEVIDEPFGE